jgi:hypothetical protein
MSASALAVPHNTSLGIEGFEDLGQSDIILPRWSIVQPTARMEGAKKHIGEFVRNLDGEFRDHLDAVLLKVSPNRILWGGEPGEFRADRSPECTSRDGVVGSVYGACATCQFNASYNKDLWGDPRAKKCNFGYSVVLVDDVEQSSMALFGVMGTSVRPMKTLTTQFIQRKRSAFSALVRLETAEITNDRGSFYVLKPTIAAWFDDAETRVWRDLYQSVAGSLVRDYEDAGEGDAAEAPF